MKTISASFGKDFTKYLSDEELCNELNFACDHLRVLIAEYTERSLHGSKKVEVTYQKSQKQRQLQEMKIKLHLLMLKLISISTKSAIVV